MRKHILFKLYRHKIIGNKHTAIENLTKSMPKHLIGIAKLEVKELIRENILLVKYTEYGLQVSLNPQKMHEIKQILYSQ